MGIYISESHGRDGFGPVGALRRSNWRGPTIPMKIQIHQTKKTGNTFLTIIYRKLIGFIEIKIKITLRWPVIATLKNHQF